MNSSFSRPPQFACFLLVFAVEAFSLGSEPAKLEVKKIGANGFAVLRVGDETPLFVQNAAPDFRPHIHPINAPDGSGLLTLKPEKNYVHHCGLWFGLNDVNKKNDFFYKNEAFHPLPLAVPEPMGNRVSWTVEDDWRPVAGKQMLRETQLWTFTDHGGDYVFDMTWRAKADIDLLFGKADYGGFFVKLTGAGSFRSSENHDPGKKPAEVLEGTRARWMSIENKSRTRGGKPAVVVIMDHRDNPDHPAPWRVTGDHFGTSRCKQFEWSLKQGEAAQARYRVVVLTGAFDAAKIERYWDDFLKTPSPKGTETKRGMK